MPLKINHKLYIPACTDRAIGDCPLLKEDCPCTAKMELWVNQKIYMVVISGLDQQYMG